MTPGQAWRASAIQAHSAEADIIIAENIVILLRLDQQPLNQVPVRPVSHGDLHDIREHLGAELLWQHHLLIGVRILGNVVGLEQSLPIILV